MNEPVCRIGELPEEVKRRLDSLVEVVFAMASFDFARKAKISERGDELDAVASGLNMLGDEVVAAQFALERERDILRSMADLLMVLGKNGEVRSTNEATRRLLGYREEELSGQPLREILADPKEQGFAGTWLEKIAAEGAVHGIEVTFRTAAGERLPLTINGSVLRDREGDLQGVVLVGRDLRDVTRLLVEVREAKRYSENIIADFLDSLVVLDLQGTIQSVNKGTLDLLGYQESDLLGQSVRLIFAEESEDILPSDKVHLLLERGNIRNYQMTYRAKDGRRIPMSFNASALRDGQGKIQGVVAGAKDVSVLRRLVDDLEESSRQTKAIQAELVHAAKLATLGQLGAGIVHELNQPLNALKLTAQSVLRDLEKKRYEPEQVPADWRSVISLVDRMARTTDHLRVFTRKAGGPTTPVNVNDAVQWATSLLHEQFRAGHIDLQTELAAELPRVLADPITLEQVFLNLVANARDSVQERIQKQKLGGGMVRVTSRVEDERVIVEVTDDGVGVPREIRHRMFEAFFTTKAAALGTGLGLYLSQQIVQAAGGEITCKPGEDSGATFRVDLPGLGTPRHPGQQPPKVFLQGEGL